LIKVSSVASKMTSLSVRDMIDALIASETRPQGAGATGTQEDARQDPRVGAGIHRLRCRLRTRQPD
jgi:hypothetical protein